MNGVPGRRCGACGFEADSEEALMGRRASPRAVALGGAVACAGLFLVFAGLHMRAWETEYAPPAPAGSALHPVFWGVCAFGGALVAWAVRGERSRGRRRCPKCWYDMSATLEVAGRAAGLRCPECGHDARRERALYRTRRRWRVAAIGAAVVALGLVGQSVPRAIRGGPVGLVPTTVLIVGMRWLPPTWYVDSADPDRATLSQRIENGEAHAWQASWARDRAAGAVRSGWAIERPSVVLAHLNLNKEPERVLGLLTVIDAFGDPAFEPTSQELLEIDSFLKSYAYRSIDAAEWPALRAALAQAAPVLAERTDPGSDRVLAQLANVVLTVRSPSPDVALLLIKKSREHSDPWWSFCLGRLADFNPVAKEEIHRLLNESEARLRLAGVRALESCSKGDLYGDLLIALSILDPEPSVRRAAADVAWQRPGIASRLAAEPDLPVEARLALAASHKSELSREQELEVIEPLLTSSDPILLRSALAWITDVAYDDMPARSLSPALIEQLARHGNAEVREHARWLLEMDASSAREEKIFRARLPEHHR